MRNYHTLNIHERINAKANSPTVLHLIHRLANGQGEIPPEVCQTPFYKGERKAPFFQTGLIFFGDSGRYMKRKRAIRHRAKLDEVEAGTKAVREAFLRDIIQHLQTIEDPTEKMRWDLFLSAEIETTNARLAASIFFQREVNANDILSYLYNRAGFISVIRRGNPNYFHAANQVKPKMPEIGGVGLAYMDHIDQQAKGLINFPEIQTPKPQQVPLENLWNQLPF
ncbi:MAG: hypothetical protein AAFW00_19710 [Bacteroidota bacterium]